MVRIGHVLLHQGSLWVTPPTQGPGMMEAARDSISPRTRATSVIPTSTSWFILVEPEFRDTADATRGHMARHGPARGRTAGAHSMGGREERRWRGLQADIRAVEAVGCGGAWRPAEDMALTLQAQGALGPGCTQPTQQARSPCGAWSSRPRCPPQPQGRRAGWWRSGQQPSSAPHAETTRHADVLGGKGGLRAPAPWPHSDQCLLLASCPGTALSRHSSVRTGRGCCERLDRSDPGSRLRFLAPHWL